MIKKYLEHTKLIGLVVIVMAFSSCGNNNNSEENNSESSDKNSELMKTQTPESLELEILKLEKMVEDPTSPNHDKITLKLIEFYESFAQLFSKNELAPDMLFRAGNQAVNLQRYNQALGYYKKVETKYRMYIKRPECIYLQGFIYETYLNELGNAKEKYEMVISEYPKHLLAAQAKQSIENMGLTDEELIKKFESQNK